MDHDNGWKWAGTSWQEQHAREVEIAVLEGNLFKFKLLQTWSVNERSWGVAPEKRDQEKNQQSEEKQASKTHSGFRVSEPPGKGAEAHRT